VEFLVKRSAFPRRLLVDELDRLLFLLLVNILEGDWLCFLISVGSSWMAFCSWRVGWLWVWWGLWFESFRQISPIINIMNAMGLFSFDLFYILNLLYWKITCFIWTCIFIPFPLVLS
jgi:hypothetical protein